MFADDYEVDLHIVRLGYVLYCIVVFPVSMTRIWSFVHKIAMRVNWRKNGATSNCIWQGGVGSVREEGEVVAPFCRAATGVRCRSWKFMKLYTQTLIWGRRLLYRKFLFFV